MPVGRGSQNHKWVGDKIGYRGVHYRIYRERGKASEHPCSAIDCTSMAQEWAYTHDDPNEKEVLVGGKIKPYSVKTEYYVALCISDHRKMDRRHGRENKSLQGREGGTPGSDAVYLGVNKGGSATF